MSKESNHPPRVPSDFTVPDGFVLITERSWTHVQNALKAFTIVAILILGSIIPLYLQVSSRNDDIRVTKKAAYEAKVAADAGTKALKAAIAQSSGSSEQLKGFIVSIEQVKAVCYQVVGQTQCDEIDRRIREGK